MLEPHSDSALPSSFSAEGPAPAVTLLRVTRDPRRLDAWTLALTSRGVSPLVRWQDGAAELYVSLADASVAAAELEAMDDEDREAERVRGAEAKRAKRPVSKHATAGAVLLAALLLAFFAWTGPRSSEVAWFSAGASDAERVLHGEWWRTVTALTLHADGAHVLSNVALGTLAIRAVMRSEGVGWGAALVFASGAAGNLLNAWAHQSLHRSVGFSTAVFGAIGILGGLGYVRSRRSSRRLHPAWTALAGTLALLALLGTSEKPNVDMLAHLFGALAGVLLGLLTEWREWRPNTLAGQALAGTSTVAAVLAAWWSALR